MLSPAVSYWETTVKPSLSHFLARWSSLYEDVETDVAIVGAGFTGLAAAWGLERRGIRCLIIDAKYPGWGASGRNGGMVVPRYKSTFPELSSRYGLDTAITLHQAAQKALSTLESIALEADAIAGVTSFRRSGHITPYVDCHQQKRFLEDCEWQAREVGYVWPRMLGQSDVTKVLGTRFYSGGYIDSQAGSLHPLQYCLNVATALTQRKVPLYSNTAITGWSEQDGELIIQTSGGRIQAKALLLATNGYSDKTTATRWMATRVAPVVSALIATQPLTTELQAQILSGRQGVTDAKRLTNYFRIENDGCLVFGGRGSVSGREDVHAYTRLRRRLEQIFPALEGMKIQNRWSGRVAITRDGLPHLNQIPGSPVYAAGGYNGRGVALSALLGTSWANWAASGFDSRDTLGLGPMASTCLARMPGRCLQLPIRQAAFAYYTLLDALEMRRRS